jgi:hypothetical protein
MSRSGINWWDLEANDASGSELVGYGCDEPNGDQLDGCGCDE